MWQNNYEEDYDDYNDGNYYDNNDDYDCDDNIYNDNENDYDECDKDEINSDDDDYEDDNDNHNYNINDSCDEEEDEEEDCNNDTSDDENDDGNDVVDDSDNDENDDEEYSNECDDDDDDDYDDVDDSNNEESEVEEYTNECDDDEDEDDDDDNIEDCDNDENEVEENAYECDDDDNDDDDNDNDDDDDDDDDDYNDEDDDDDDNYFDYDEEEECDIDTRDDETDDDEDYYDNDENYDSEDIDYSYGQNYHENTEHKCISRHQRKKDLSKPVLRLLEMIFEETFNGNQAAAYAKYKTLNTSIKLLSTNTEEYQIICQYVTNGHGPTHKFKITIEHIFEIHRSEEYAEFQKNKKRHRRLLWHGTTTKNLVSILQNGLLIEAPPGTPKTGKMFGKGIYFADVCTKAAQYCKVDGNDPYGLMILADVALGRQYYLTKAQDVQELRNGKHSVKGLGKYKPDFSKSVKHKYGAYVPNGPLQHKTDVNTALDYSEYVVYKHDRIMLEYLVLVKFQC